ncbi:hypothetical protein N9I12_02440 [Gammaproteobacteria bacterium]|nr:hypothetical protein [Gammaproteobacteria bacterium]
MKKLLLILPILFTGLAFPAKWDNPINGTAWRFESNYISVVLFDTPRDSSGNLI